MAEVHGEDRSGSRFDAVDLREASFRNLTLSGSTFVGADLCGVVMKGVERGRVRIEGEIADLVINGRRRPVGRGRTQPWTRS